jgi:hypothetical protein
MRTWTRTGTIAVGLILGVAARATAAPELPVLMVADEIPAMEVLAKQLATRSHTKATIVKQADLPSSLTPFRAVLVYIHGGLGEPAEKALLDYAEAGGNLILLHHTISSGKRKNTRWLPAFGVTLPTGDFAAGGYKYIDDATWDLVNLAPPGHPIMKGVEFPKKVEYTGGSKRPALTLDGTEIYLNHVLAGPRTVLLGLRYEDPQTKKVFMQDTAAWTRSLGKGRVTYFMPGHKGTDFDRPAFAQLIANTVTLPPGK